jgi:hypothetical protein
VFVKTTQDFFPLMPLFPTLDTSLRRQPLDTTKTFRGLEEPLHNVVRARVRGHVPETLRQDATNGGRSRLAALGKEGAVT